MGAVKMKSIAVIKPDMAVMQRDKMGLSPFGLLSMAFYDTIRQRSTWNTGFYREVPLELLEEQMEDTTAPTVPEIHFDIDLQVILQRLRNKEKKDTPEGRILDRIRQLEQSLGRMQAENHVLSVKAKQGAEKLPQVGSNMAAGFKTAGKVADAMLTGIQMRMQHNWFMQAGNLPRRASGSQGQVLEALLQTGNPLQMQNTELPHTQTVLSLQDKVAAAHLPMPLSALERHWLLKGALSYLETENTVGKQDFLMQAGLVSAMQKQSIIDSVNIIKQANQIFSGISKPEIRISRTSLTAQKKDITTAPVDVALKPHLLQSSQPIKQKMQSLKPVAANTGVPAGNGWTPYWQAEHPGFDRGKPIGKVPEGKANYSILLPDILRQRQAMFDTSGTTERVSNTEFSHSQQAEDISLQDKFAHRMTEKIIHAARLAANRQLIPAQDKQPKKLQNDKISARKPHQESELLGQNPSEVRLGQESASPFVQTEAQELSHPAEMVLLQQKEGQPETHTAQESSDSSETYIAQNPSGAPETHTAQKYIHQSTILTSQHLAQKPAHSIQAFDTLPDMAYLPMQMVPPQAEKTDKPNGTMQNLPDWAKRFLQQQTPIKSAAPMVWNVQADANGIPSRPQQQIQWQAPNALQQPSNIVYREQGQKQQQLVQQSPGLTDYELRRTADKVYHLIEDRLRREFRRSGR